MFIAPVAPNGSQAPLGAQYVEPDITLLKELELEDGLPSYKHQAPKGQPHDRLPHIRRHSRKRAPSFICERYALRFPRDEETLSACRSIRRHRGSGRRQTSDSPNGRQLAR
jgi:hypothetical protein